MGLTRKCVIVTHMAFSNNGFTDSPIVDAPPNNTVSNTLAKAAGIWEFSIKKTDIKGLFKELGHDGTLCFSCCIDYCMSERYLKTVVIIEALSDTKWKETFRDGGMKRDFVNTFELGEEIEAITNMGRCKVLVTDSMGSFNHRYTVLEELKHDSPGTVITPYPPGMVITISQTQSNFDKNKSTRIFQMNSFTM